PASVHYSLLPPSPTRRSSDLCASATWPPKAPSLPATYTHKPCRHSGGHRKSTSWDLSVMTSGSCAPRAWWKRSLIPAATGFFHRSEEHTSELQSRGHLVCRLL